MGNIFLLLIHSSIPAGGSKCITALIQSSTGCFPHSPFFFSLSCYNVCASPFEAASRPGLTAGRLLSGLCVSGQEYMTQPTGPQATNYTAGAQVDREFSLLHVLLSDVSTPSITLMSSLPRCSSLKQLRFYTNHYGSL